MRISDWSSDVCSSDLGGVATASGMVERIQSAFSNGLGSYGLGAASRSPEFITKALLMDAGLDGAALMAHVLSEPGGVGSLRSEVRRVGKEGVRTFRFRWSSYH